MLNTLTRFVNDAMIEKLVRKCENEMLMLLKYQQQMYPNKQNDREYVECSEYVLSRRKRHKSRLNMN